jgi:hypothetical protein
VAEAHWAVIPFVNGLELTQQATLDLLAQSLPTRVLLVANGASEAIVSPMREWVEPHHPRVLLWTWAPGLPSLSGCWNRALEYVWALGGTEALVVNHDVRLHQDTYRPLLEVLDVTHSLFVSAVGVREGQFDPATSLSIDGDAHGGPDFSCFLISKAGHERYPFDEQFIPGYREDVDAHRRYMLGGDGDKIFSVNLPFLHYASGTIKQHTPEERQRFNQQYAAGGEYYKRKWGGPVNEETFQTPFGAEEPEERDRVLPVTTPDLQRYWQIARRPTDAPQAS